nr:hypothetical protein [Tanacetum cinerariifolium]
LPDGAEADFHLRWFTPTFEIDLCGHATLATAHVLWTERGFAKPEIVFQSQSGPLRVRREADGRLVLDFPSRPPQPLAVAQHPAALLPSLGPGAAAPLAVLASRDLVVEFASADEVLALRPDFVALADLGYIGLIATAPGGEGVDFVSRFFAPEGGQCDLLLLDVEMPNLSGLELAKLLPAPAPAIVLVTTHRTFAVAAFELQAIDYLVKPVEFGRFSQAIARVLASRAAARAAAAPAAPAKADTGTELFVKVGTRTIKVDFDDVLYIEALSTYSVLVTPTHKHIVYLTLKSLAERLPFRHFLRVHRSYIVNMQR